MSEMRLDPVVVGEVIAAYRLRKGVTQEVLSGLADISAPLSGAGGSPRWKRSTGSAWRWT